MQHLQNEITKLKKLLLGLCARVEESVRDAVKAIETRDEALARRVIDSDVDIDTAEVDVEEECLKILALHQPVAIDLRFLVAVLKINNDLERVGDLAANMAERAVYLAAQPKPNIKFDFSAMAQKTQHMLRNSLDALMNLDAGLARKVCAMDDEVDAMNRQVYEVVKAGVLEAPEHVNVLVHYLSAARHLERIADHATNISEDIIYMIEGEIVRHKHEEYS